jgi:hypothetical protein
VGDAPEKEPSSGGGAQQRPGAGLAVRRVHADGGGHRDLEYFPLYCGESCTLVNDIKRAGDVVREIVAEAEGVLQSRRG